MWILAVDGGGSKTLARLTNTSTGQHWQQQAGPASLTNDFSLALSNINLLSASLCQQAGISSQQVVAVLGLAGAGNPQQHQQACQQLARHYASFLLTTDAKTSLYGANLGQPVLVVALGTGSVAMRLLGDGAEQQVGGWGFNIGDEGGGAWLGKQAVRELLWQVDSLAGVQSPLLQAVAQQIGDDAAVLLPWLKTASPNDYAALAPLVFNYAGRCEVADTLLQRHSSAVHQLLWSAREQFELPVVLLGGLADITAPLLNTECRALLQPPRGSALDGAFILATQLTHSLPLSGNGNDK
ncbi:glucosamine kinase [Rheinheimera pacifica]|uniref:BadF/BadG/BcrA/BcrD ATPase family protein n=1 Tax=Rheinheimera pacifica TaxID=173990 RepID=UPI00216A960A|nr:BadF/BadG/BcrA/BcrD ATPase family protein [Rheinheimera pacifica]MCS4308163.1 glucosamine kinase [Rheinheimera pacifica]